MDVIADYDYRDEHGKVLFQAVRLEPKSFRQRHRNGSGDWTWNLDGVRRVPYRLPDALAAIEAGRTIFVVEGEKDVERLADEGLVATCNPMGAGKWTDDYSALLAAAPRVIIVPDNDEPGRAHAEAVASSLVAAGVADVRILALPDLPEHGDVSDWLDAGHTVGQLKGAVGSARRVTGASADVAGGAEPFEEVTPLGLGAGESSPFPVDALPESIREAVVAYQRYGQQPVALIASSALACVSFVCQGHANVARDEVLVGPISLALMPVGESGERKTSCDRALGRPIDDYLAERESEVEAARVEHQREHDRWSARVDALKSDYRKAVSKREGADSAEKSLADAQAEEPEAPVEPPPKFSDVTREEIVRRLAKSEPIGALWDDEAGNVMGAVGMRDEAVIGFLSVVNKLWDGSPLRADRVSLLNARRSSGKRVTVNLMLQEAVLEALLEARGGVARSLGFLSRVLLCKPETTIGKRQYRPPADVAALLAGFHRRLTAHLQAELPIRDGTRAELDPPRLRLCPAAHHVWRDFYNDLERYSDSGEPFEIVRDVAAKSAENAARLAALFHLFEGCAPADPLGDEHMTAGTEIAAWYVDEARRVLGGHSVPEAILSARLLFDWLLDAEERHEPVDGPITVRLKAVSQYGPYRVRTKDARDRAVMTLVEHGHVRVARIGGASCVVLNPEAVEADR